MLKLILSCVGGWLAGSATKITKHPAKAGVGTGAELGNSGCLILHWGKADIFVAVVSQKTNVP